MTGPKALLLTCFVLILIGCGTDNMPATDAPLSEFDALPSDDIIIGKVYAPVVSTPVDFLRDSTVALSGAFTLRHVRSADVQHNAPMPFELCTNEMTQAMDWSAAADARQPASGPLLSVSENNRYFEMTRQIDNLPDWVAIERVFKCTYLNRNGADASATTGPAGQFNQTPLTTQSLRELAEYLWQFSTQSNPGNAVLDSSGHEHETGLSHTLTLATLTRNASGCDQIDVYDWLFDASRDGQLETSRQPVLRLFSQSSGGIATSCSP